MSETAKDGSCNNNEKVENIPDVSVIVPIYNVDKYLNRCIDSIINQIFTNIEIILVNDGSLDTSPQICDHYARLDNRVKVIHKENSGQSDARNAGIEVSRGRYLAFVDSDDYIDPSYIAVLFYAAQRNDCEISYCNYAIYRQEKGTHKTINFRKPLPGVTTGRKIAKLTIRDFRSRAYLWNKLYKRELFFNEEKIRFPKIYFEDTATTPRLMFFAKRIVVVDKCLYYYTKRKGSIVSRLDVRKMNDYILALGVLRNFFEKHHCYSKFRWSHLWLAILMAVAAPCNIFRAFIHEDNRQNLFKNSVSGVLSGWKCIWYFVCRKFRTTDDVVPEMPFPLYTDSDEK